MKCEACMQSALAPESMKCYICSKRFHHQCINMTSAQYRELNKDTWRCPGCENVTRRRLKRGDETPTRKQFEQESASAPAMSAMKVCDPHSGYSSDASAALSPTVQAAVTCPPVTYEQISLLLDTKLDNFRKAITSEFSDVLSKMRASFREEIATLKAENAALGEGFTTLEKKVSSTDVSKMTEAICDLQFQLNEREQDLLSNDVEITCIPEYDGESVGHIVMAVATKLGMKLEERDIVSAGRAGPKRSPVEGTAAPRPRPIVVRLACRPLREELIKSARVCRGATTAELGLPQHEPHRFYVNERLTKTNRALFARARDAGREAHWRFIWTRDGRIYGRKEHSSQRVILRSEKDVTFFVKA